MEQAQRLEKTGQRIKECREAAGISVSQAAEWLKVSTQTVYAWENGQSQPKSHRLMQLASLYGVTIAWLREGLGDPRHGIGSKGRPLIAAERSVPVIAMDDLLAYMTEDEAPVSPTKWCHPFFDCSSASVAVTMPDRSMSPTIEPGDVMVIDPEMPPMPGDLVAYSLQGRTAMVRQYAVQGYTVCLEAENHLWPEEHIDIEDVNDVFFCVGVVTEIVKPRRV